MLIVGIAGGSGSGKTTFAHKVQERTNGNITILHMDSYYLNIIPNNLGTSNGKPNFDHPEAFDWELLKTHLHLLRAQQEIEVPIYNFNSNSRLAETSPLKAKDVIILEGILSLHDPEMRELIDIKCFLNVDSDIRFIRRLHRDIEERGRTRETVVSQYYETVRPMYKKFLEPQQQYADFIIGEETSIASDILAAKINQHISLILPLHNVGNITEQCEVQ